MINSGPVNYLFNCSYVPYIESLKQFNFTLSLNVALLVTLLNIYVFQSLALLLELLLEPFFYIPCSMMMKASPTFVPHLSTPGHRWCVPGFIVLNLLRKTWWSLLPRSEWTWISSSSFNTCFQEQVLWTWDLKTSSTLSESSQPYGRIPTPTKL